MAKKESHYELCRKNGERIARQVQRSSRSCRLISDIVEKCPREISEMIVSDRLLLATEIVPGGERVGDRMAQTGAHRTTADAAGCL